MSDPDDGYDGPELIRIAQERAAKHIADMRAAALTMPELRQTTNDRIQTAIASHAWVIATYIRELTGDKRTHEQLARNVGSAVMLAIRKQREADLIRMISEPKEVG